MGNGNTSSIGTRQYVAIIAFSILFACSCGFSSWIDGSGLFKTAWLTILYAIVSGAFFLMLFRFLPIVGGGVSLRRHYSIIAFSVVFCLYLLQFLVNWPGVCTPDSGDAMHMALGESELINWTPIFYMLLVAPFVNFGTFIGNYDLGVALYSLVQLTATAAVLTYVFVWLCKKGFPKVLCIGAFLFFALDPVIARYSITMWKDVPFSLCMVLYVLCLADVVLAKNGLSKRKAVSLVVLSLLVGLLRNNGLFIVVGTLAVLVIASRKKADWERGGFLDRGGMPPRRTYVLIQRRS